MVKTIIGSCLFSTRKDKATNHGCAKHNNYWFPKGTNHG